MENIYQATVVWRLDNTIQWINLYTVDSELRDVLLSLIRGIAIYSLDNVIHPSYNKA